MAWNRVAVVNGGGRGTSEEGACVCPQWWWEGERQSASPVMGWSEGAGRCQGCHLVSGLVSRPLSTLGCLFILGSPGASYLPTGSQPGLPLKTSLALLPKLQTRHAIKAPVKCQPVGARTSLRICWTSLSLIDSLGSVSWAW